MKRKHKMPRYEILGVEENKIMNKYLNTIGSKYLQEMLATKMDMPEGCLYYNVLIGLKDRKETLGIFAKDELEAWKKAPKKLKSQWDEYKKRNRYGRPK